MRHRDLAGWHVNIDVVQLQCAIQERKFWTSIDSCNPDVLAIGKRQGQFANMNLPEEINLNGTGSCASAGNEFADLCFVEGLTPDDACSSNSNNRNRRP
ncbi:hypothetical protein D3C87_1441760 [compost metagenome]